MYNNFENKLIKCSGKFATQYIAAWCRAGGRIDTYADRDRFHEWLKAMGLSKLEARHTINLITLAGGKEFVDLAKEFVNKDTEQE